VWGGERSGTERGKEGKGEADVPPLSWVVSGARQDPLLFSGYTG
jgi:hypothetical protein